MTSTTLSCSCCGVCQYNHVRQSNYVVVDLARSVRESKFKLKASSDEGRAFWQKLNKKSWEKRA